MRPRAEPEQTVGAGERSACDGVARLCAATRDVLRALGAAGTAEWQVTERDRYDVSGPGERPGPSTLTRHVWRDGDALAEIALDVVRWSEHDVHQTTLSARWAVGDASAGIVTVVSGAGPFRRASVRGPQAVADVLEAALRRKP